MFSVFILASTLKWTPWTEIISWHPQLLQLRVRVIHQGSQRKSQVLHHGWRFQKKMSSHQKGIQLQICHNHCSFLAFFNDMSFFSLCLLCSAQGAQGAHEEPNAAEVAADAADEASQIALRCQPWNAKSLRWNWSTSNAREEHFAIIEKHTFLESERRQPRVRRRSTHEPGLFCRRLRGSFDLGRRPAGPGFLWGQSSCLQGVPTNDR